jgi:hypothetical protein
MPNPKADLPGADQPMIKPVQKGQPVGVERAYPVLLVDSLTSAAGAASSVCHGRFDSRSESETA